MDDIILDEPKHPQKLTNSAPETLTRFTYTVVEILENYGWFIALGVFLTLYLLHKLRPHIEKWKNQINDYSNKKTDDPNRMFIQQESMERSRRLLQERINIDAQRMKEKKQEHEAEKRREKIEDWERHQLGQGYRSKAKKPQDDSNTELAKATKPKLKKTSRPNDYNPLMGHRGGSSYRPSSRGGQSGGG